MRTALCLLLLPAAALAAPPSATLTALANDYWEFHLREAPEEATFLGDHRYDDRLTDLSPEAIQRRQLELAKLRQRLAQIPQRALQGEEVLTYQLLARELDEALEEHQFHFERDALNQMDGPQVTFLQLALKIHPRRDKHDLATLLARYRAFPTFMNQYIANLRDGLGHNQVAARVVVERVIDQLRKVPQVAAELSKPGPEFQAATVSQVLPAFSRLLAFLEKEYLPHARADVGIWAQPDGKALYAYEVRHHTTTRRTPEELHQLGLSELQAIEAEMKQIAARIAPGKKLDVRQLADWMREQSKRDHFATRDQLVEEYRKILAKTDAQLGRVVTRAPSIPYKVEAMPAYQERDSPAAYYYPPTEDGSREGIFFVNTWKPETRPKYEMESLAAHEAVPGHHLQIATSYDLKELPKFRRLGEVTAFVEGWGLYAERLVDELGLYTSDAQRYGMLSGQAWRACRLVVDTGMHAMKWTRKQAIDFMLAHTAAPTHEVEVEIDRYIVWPGQALAYMVGEREILDARAEAQKKLGKDFSLPKFHDALLGSGALPLETLRAKLRGTLPSF